MRITEMKRRSRNTQMFALSDQPPGTVAAGGATYRLVRVFKHDFLAATCLYEADGASRGAEASRRKIVVKFGRIQVFCGLPMAWIGRFLRAHEEAIYRVLRGVGGVPRWVGRIEPAAYAIEYVEGRPLDHLQEPPEGFFDRLREVFDAIHARGVGYCDANKRSNVIVAGGDRPFLVDYQISIRRRDDLPWPLRAVVAAAVRYVAHRDIYHLYKHKRRMCPQRLRPEERELSFRRTGLHLLHRKLTKSWRYFRRRFLRKQYETGRLTSPTADLEDHYQPEKDGWRGERPPEGDGR